MGEGERERERERERKQEAIECLQTTCYER